VFNGFKPMSINLQTGVKIGDSDTDDGVSILTGASTGVALGSRSVQSGFKALTDSELYAELRNDPNSMGSLKGGFYIKLSDPLECISGEGCVSAPRATVG
jgi:hypothetical protein